MKKIKRRPTLRARRLDLWRKIHPNRKRRSFAKGTSSGRHHIEIIFGSPFYTKLPIGFKPFEDMNMAFETLERQLFGHRVALYNKLARS